jgi:Sel1 repeat
MRYRGKGMIRKAMILTAILASLAGCATSPEEQANQAFAAGDYQTALAGYQALAEKGDPVAEGALAYMYYTGSGVPKDVVTARHWYEKAAVDGDARSARNLGNHYLLPDEGSPDYAEAFKWFTLAAGRGDAYSELELSILYEHGLGVARDTGAAQHWTGEYIPHVHDALEHINRKHAGGDLEAFKVALDQAVWQTAHYSPDVKRILSGKLVLSFRFQDGHAVDVAVEKSSGDPDADAVAVTVLQKALLPAVPESLSGVGEFKISFDFESEKREPPRIVYGRQSGR